MFFKKMRLRGCLRRGREDYAKGIPLAENPFSDFDEMNHWEWGWFGAEAEAQKTNHPQEEEPNGD